MRASKYFDRPKTRRATLKLGVAALGVLVLPSVVAPRIASSVQAQNFRFNLRAEPDVIAANGISTTSILVQVQNNGSAISAAPVVRFISSAGSIEPQARLSGGFARVLLRSSTTPGTALVTAMVGSSREQVTVEFSADDLGVARYLQVGGKYVAYGSNQQHITASGPSSLDYGDLHIESDVRLDVDMSGERVWAEGGSGRVLIRHGSGGKMHELRGDRLFYDLRRRRGVMRRSDASMGAARQEFMDNDFRALPNSLPAILPGDEPARPIVPLAPDKDTLEPPLRPDADTPAAPPTPETAPAPTSEPAIIQTRPVDGILLDREPTTRVALQQNPDLILPNADAPVTEPATETADVTRATIFGRLDENKPNGERVAVLTPEIGRAMPDRTASGTSVLPGGLDLLSPQNRNDKDGVAPGTEQSLPTIPSYSELPPTSAPQSTLIRSAKIVEPIPPDVDVTNGYWVVARRVRVFPHDKVQFEHSTVFFNGRKLFAMPRYVASLNGSFNPATDMMAFNTSGGVTLNVPYYYQASPRGTGTLYIQHAPGKGFAAEKPGFALALDQQYWMSDRSQGRFIVDQIGRGGWNLNWEHKLQFSPTARGEIYFDMPRHRDAYLRSSVLKDFRSMQIGFEGLMSRLSERSSSSIASPLGRSNMQGQFFARLRPKSLGRTGWNYTLSANVIAVRRFAYLQAATSGNGGAPGGGTGGTGGGTGGLPGGGGIGLPGRPRSALSRAIEMAVIGTNARNANTTHNVRPLWGQTLLATFQAPTRRLWKGASLQSSVLGSAFNYSDGRRGVAPGLTMGLHQELGRVGSIQLDYNYDKGRLGLLNTLSDGDYTHFMSGSLLLNLSSKISGNAYFTRSLSDGSLYGAAGLDFYPVEKWRMGLFSDYSRFDSSAFLNYGLSIGRQVGQREISLNWSRDRNKIFFELGNLPY